MDDETRARFDALDAAAKRLDSAVEQQGTLTTKLFDLVDERLEAIQSHLERHDKQLHAIVTRLDEQDVSHDRLMTKVDRLSVLARAGEEAMTSLDALARRVAKLEAARRGNEG